MSSVSLQPRMAKVQQARGGGPTTTTLHQMATLSPQANSGTVTRSGSISNELNFLFNLLITSKSSTNEPQ